MPCPMQLLYFIYLQVGLMMLSVILAIQHQAIAMKGTTTNIVNP
jgi:hypothetical protein